MKAHIGVDQDSGLTHSVAITSANVHDVTMAAELLHGEEREDVRTGCGVSYRHEARETAPPA